MMSLIGVSFTTGWFYFPCFFKPKLSFHFSNDILFIFFSGAASVAGQSYTGAVFVSKDGNWPEERHHQRIKLALEKCGIKPWELFSVDNSSCSSAPLGLPDDIPSPVSIV